MNKDNNAEFYGRSPWMDLLSLYKKLNELLKQKLKRNKDERMEKQPKRDVDNARKRTNGNHRD